MLDQNMKNALLHLRSVQIYQACLALQGALLRYLEASAH